MSLVNLSSKDLGNAIAVIRTLQNAGYRTPDSQVASINNELETRRTGAVRANNLCPACGASIKPGCNKARTCPTCDHAWKPQWRQLEGFGRGR